MGSYSANTPNVAGRINTMKWSTMKWRVANMQPIDTEKTTNIINIILTWNNDWQVNERHSTKRGEQSTFYLATNIYGIYYLMARKCVQCEHLMRLLGIDENMHWEATKMLVLCEKVKYKGRIVINNNFYYDWQRWVVRTGFRGCLFFKGKSRHTILCRQINGIAYGLRMNHKHNKITQSNSL